VNTPTLKSSQKPQHASAGKFLGFSIHENGIVIDPKKIESIQKVQPPQTKNDMQKFIGKLNYLRWFIFNLSGRLVHLLQYSVWRMSLILLGGYVGIS
jgi:hypothetical protein